MRALPRVAVTTLLAIAIAVPVRAERPGPHPAVLFTLATARRDAGDLRAADSLARFAIAAMRDFPPRSDAERLACERGRIANLRPTSDAEVESLAVWTPRLMARPASAFPGAELEGAWYDAGRAYHNAGRLDSLRAAFARAIAAQRARPEHSAIEEAWLFARIATQHLAGARTREIRPFATAALAAWNAGPRADSLPLALAQVALARVQAETGHVDSARAALEDARGVIVRHAGPDSGHLLLLWRTLAATRAISDDPRGAIALVREARRIATLTRPPGDAEFVNLATQASSAASSSGDYVQGAIEGRLAVEAAERRYGHVHGTTATALLGLANSQRHLGDYASALANAKEGLAIVESVRRSGAGDRSYALAVLAAIESNMGDYGTAERHFAEVARLRENPGAPPSAGFLFALGGQAEAAVGLRRWAEAESLLRRVEAVQLERRLYPQLEDTWGDLSRVQLAAGHADSALATAGRLVAMADTVHGRDSEPAATYRAARLMVLRAAGHTREAFEEALALAALGRRHTWWASASLSEREGLAAAEQHSAALSAALDLAAGPGLPADAVSRAWEQLARTRALVFRVQAARRERRAAHGEAAEAYARVDAARAALARALIDGREGAARGDSLRRAAEDAERALAALVPAHVDEPDREVVAPALAALPAGERLVAFARVAAPEDTLAGAAVHGSCYVALVGGRTLRPRLVPLGDAEAIEAKVARWNALSTRGARDAAGEADLARRCRDAGDAVRRALWDPLAPLLAGATRVDVVPDGAASNVDFAALPAAGPGDAWLVERGPLVALLATEQDLAARPHEGRGLLALGGPEFGARDGDARLAANTERRARRDSLRLHFDPLPASAEEAKEVAAAWSAARPGEPATVLVGERASEPALRESAPGREVLHLATHAFLVDGRGAAPGDSGTRGVGALATTTAPRAVSGTADWSVAGLALAGANASDGARDAADDGYCTGAELAALDLSRVRCAVLSACRTGAVQADRFESVQGLERALRIAGVGQVVMSLGPVADEDARAWMRAFDPAWLGGKRSLAEAVRAADLERLRALRAAGEPARPGRWAPFFARGERE